MGFGANVNPGNAKSGSLLLVLDTANRLTAADTQIYATKWRDNQPPMANGSFPLDAPGKNGFIGGWRGPLAVPKIPKSVKHHLFATFERATGFLEYNGHGI